MRRDLDERIAEVRGALGRLDKGSFGRCEYCGRPIDDGRLHAVPATRRCREHSQPGRAQSAC